MFRVVTTGAVSTDRAAGSSGGGTYRGAACVSVTTAACAASDDIKPSYSPRLAAPARPTLSPSPSSSSPPLKTHAPTPHAPTPHALHTYALIYLLSSDDLRDGVDEARPGGQLEARYLVHEKPNDIKHRLRKDDITVSGVYPVPTPPASSESPEMTAPCATATGSAMTKRSLAELRLSR
jgi:hypothetical protein